MTEIKVGDKVRLLEAELVPESAMKDHYDSSLLPSPGDIGTVTQVILESVYPYSVDFKLPKYQNAVMSSIVRVSEIELVT